MQKMSAKILILCHGSAISCEESCRQQRSAPRRGLDCLGNAGLIKEEADTAEVFVEDIP